jgi:hypothetical protein
VAKLGRPRISFEYDEACEYVQGEMLKSKGEYDKWWLYNKPARIPKNPDRAYKVEWIGWGDFLGVYNDFPNVRTKRRDFKEARAWVHSHHINNVEEWRVFCKRADFPADIPKRPDVYYRDSLEWLTWKDWLGYKVIDKIAKIGETDHIILITKHSNRPNNVYDIGMTNLGKDNILSHQQKTGFKIVAAFYHDKESNWVEPIAKYMQQYDETSFIVPNIADILSYLSLHYLPVRW